MALLSSGTESATALMPHTAADAYTGMMLAARVNQLEIDMQRLMLSAGLTDQPLQFFRTQRSVKETLGVTFEIVSSIPLMHSINATDHVFWGIMSTDSVDNDPVYCDAAIRMLRAAHLLTIGQCVGIVSDRFLSDVHVKRHPSW